MSSARLPKVIRTASFKLAAAYAALFVVSALVLGAVVFWVVASALERQRVEGIEAEMAFLQVEYAAEGLAELIEETGERISSGRGGGLYYAVVSADGRLLAGNLTEAPDRIGWQDIDYPIGGLNNADTRLRVLVVDIGNSVRLAVGDDFGLIEEIHRVLLGAFGWVLLAFLILGLAGGWLASSGFLKRVDLITKTADAIISGDVTRRIPIRGTDDDFDRLSATLNRMLDRISGLLESLRQVSNDIAHDLKTPLTRLRNGLAAAKSSSRQGPERAAIAAAIGETDRVLDTFSALLRIAQIESGTRRAGFRDVDLSCLVATVADDFRPVAEGQKKSLITDIQAGVATFGDQELLTQMLANLIENAIRHTPGDTQICLSLRSTASGVVAIVRDNGPGIPLEEREHVFRRFHRLERSRTTQGHGLGLSLVAAIADLHGIEVVVEDNAPGLAVILRIADPAR